MSKEDPKGVRMSLFCEAVGWTVARLRNGHQKGPLPFEVDGNTSGRLIYGGKEAFAVACASALEETGIRPAIACDRVIFSNCVKEYLWRRDKGEAISDLYLISGKFRELDDWRTYSHDFVGDHDRLKEAISRNPIRLEILNLHEVYNQAVVKAEASGCKLDGWDLLKIGDGE